MFEFSKLEQIFAEIP